MSRRPLRALRAEEPEPESRALPRWPIYTFVPLALLVLKADGRQPLALGIDGRLVGNLITPAYFGLLVWQAHGRLRAMLVLIVPLSLVAEAMCSLVLGLYTYRLDEIPLYVPFGHGVIFGTGFLLDRSPFMGCWPRATRIALGLFFAVLFVQALLLSHDTLSLVLGILFFGLLGWQRFESLYLAMGVVVLLVEVLGTHFGCWMWQARPLGVLGAANPPVGAITFYVYGDLVVGFCYGLLSKSLMQWGAEHPLALVRRHVPWGPLSATTGCCWRRVWWPS